MMNLGFGAAHDKVCVERPHREDSRMEEDLFLQDLESYTRVPSDSEDSDAYDFRALTTLSTDMDVERTASEQGGVLDKTHPLMLAIDADDRVQVVQTDYLISAETLERATREMEKSTKGAFAKMVSLRDMYSLAPAPGTFFRAPPGLDEPDFAVTSKAGNDCSQQSTQESCSSVATWVLEARQLRSSANVLISPRFQFTGSCEVPFRVIIHPKEKEPGCGCGRVSFKLSRGVGTVLIKSEADTPDTVSITLSTGRQQVSLVHDFSKTSTCRLPGHLNFLENVLGAEETVTISVAVTKTVAMSACV
eukprot:TRINITY_DN16658_c0_g1_i3.p1 TRINITY_DN16658_c0_g1~~TRINITY_DN16658_c0_g1_i3.p1  ORF type:complete len:305 (-),score=32.38 TRINITY_DN16658_c0_g1_i3:418-1332(-)